MDLAEHSSFTNWGDYESNVGFWWEGKTGVPRETFQNRVQNQQNQSTCESRVRKSNPSHIGGGRVLSPLQQPAQCCWHCFVARNNEVEKPVHCNWAMQFQGDTRRKRRINAE